MKKSILFLLLIAFVMTSCAGLSSRPKARSASDLGQNQTIIVGKIVFDPPLTPESQDLNFGYDAFRYQIYMICGTKLREIVNEAALPGSGDLNGSIEAVQDETFYTINRNVPIYMIAGIFYKGIYVQSCGYQCTRVLYDPVGLPASFYIDIKPADKAVYIGTIKYTRDNFWNVTRIQILDEYDKELPAFRIKFKGIKLTKALIREPGKDAVLKIGSPY